MKTTEFIEIPRLCEEYKVEHSFFTELYDKGVIQVSIIEQTHCVHHDYIPVFEKVVRLNRDLHINVEGIDVILNLLDKIDDLNSQLKQTKNRLHLYE